SRSAAASPRRIGGSSSRTDMNLPGGEGRIRVRATMMRERDEARKAAGERLDSALVKIYTRVGDDGSTGLLGKGRVSKSDPRVEAYGSIDELNAALGTVRALDEEHGLAADLERVQSE